MQDDLKEFKVSEKIRKKFKNKHLIINDLEENKTLQEILDFSDETLSKFYQAAYFLFEQKRYIEASNAFLFLITLNPYQYDYWLALGMANQMCHEYEAAIDAYEVAALCDLFSPLPYLYLAKCLFAIHDRQSSLQALELAIEMASDNEEYADCKQQAEIAKDILLNHDH